MNRWLLGILCGFAVMVVVNAAFIYIAVSGADEVVPSYNVGER